MMTKIGMRNENPMKATVGFLGLVLIALIFGAGRCSKYAVHLDTIAVAAQEANDATVIIQGCGSQPVVGYTYCRMTEGLANAQPIRIHVPPTACAKDSCVNLRFYTPSGQPAHEINVPRGQTVVEVEWPALLKKNTFDRGDKGFWPILQRWEWVDDNGYPHFSVAEGEIRLRVLKEGYSPLHEFKDAPEFGWRWFNNDGVYRVSTQARAYAGVNQ